MRVGIVERIVAEIRRHADQLVGLLTRPGQLIIHVNPANKADPVTLEVRVKM